MVFVLSNQKITPLWISNCISHNFWAKLKNSVHTAVTACSSGNSGSSLFKAHWSEIFHTDLVLKMSIPKWTDCVGNLNTFLDTPGCTLKIRQSTIYYAGSLGPWDKQIVNQASDVPSIIFFHDFFFLFFL